MGGDFNNADVLRVNYSKDYDATIASQTDERWSLALSLATACLVAVTAYVQWQDIYVALFFAYLAYWSYTMLSMSSGPGQWR